MLGAVEFTPLRCFLSAEFTERTVAQLGNEIVDFHLCAFLPIAAHAVYDNSGVAISFSASVQGRRSVAVDPPRTCGSGYSYLGMEIAGRSGQR
jgi:hypothetical protein